MKIEIKGKIEEYSDQELKFIAKKLEINNFNNLNRKSLISNINKKFTQNKMSDIPLSFGGLSISLPFFDFWYRALEKYKITTILTTIMFFISLVFGINYLENKDAMRLEKAKKESLELKNRLKDLEEIEVSLKKLIFFIENQKKTIISTEEDLKDLKKQKKELEPIVSTKKEIVEAIFKEQENRNRENRWIERFMGFFIGIAASIFASIIFGSVKRLSKRNIKTKEKQN